MIKLKFKVNGCWERFDGVDLTIYPDGILDASNQGFYPVDLSKIEEMELSMNQDYFNEFAENILEGKMDDKCKRCGYKMAAQIRRIGMEKAQKIISAYVNLRDEVKRRDAAHKEDLKTLKTNMSLLEDELTKILKANGLESMKTDAGTAFESTNTFANLVSYDDFVRGSIELAMKKVYKDQCSDELVNTIMAAMLEDGPLHFLNKSVGKVAVMEYMSEHDDIPPTGISITQETTVQVRRPTKSKPKK